MPILFAVAGSALGCFAEGAILWSLGLSRQPGCPQSSEKQKVIRGMGKGHGADSKPHISAALSSRPFPHVPAGLPHPSASQKY